MSTPDVSLTLKPPPDLKLYPRPGIEELLAWIDGRDARDSRRTERIVELGADAPLVARVHALRPAATFVVVDGANLDHLEPANLAPCTLSPTANYARGLELLEGDSHDVSTIGAALELLDNQGPDLLIIEADFSYAGVVIDVARWSLHIPPGAILVVAGVDDPDSGPGRFWANDVGPIWYARQTFGRYGSLTRQ